MDALKQNYIMLKNYGYAMCAMQASLRQLATYIVHSCKNNYNSCHHATQLSSLSGQTRENVQNMSKFHLHFDLKLL